MGDAFSGASAPGGVVVEDARLDLQLVCFLVRTEEIHENLHAVLDSQRSPVFATQVCAGLGICEGIEKSQSLFFWRDEVLCTARPNPDSSLEGLTCLSISMASIGGDFRRLSATSVEPFLVLLFLVSVFLRQSERADSGRRCRSEGAGCEGILDRVVRLHHSEVV